MVHLGQTFTSTGQCMYANIPRRCIVWMHFCWVVDWGSSAMIDVVVNALPVRLSMAADQPDGSSADPWGDYPRR